MHKLNNIVGFDISSLSLIDYISISSGRQLGIFKILEKTSLTLSQLQNKTFQSKQIVESLVYSLVASGYLKIVGDLVSINPQYSFIFSSEEMVVFDNFDWYFLVAQFPSKIKLNKKVRISKRTFNSFIDISEKITKDIFLKVVEDIPQVKTDRLNILDLGCGKMALSRYLLSINQNIDITGIDNNKYGLKFIKKYIKTKQLESKIELINADVLDAVSHLTCQYNLIILSQLIHWLRKESILTCLNICKKLLKPDGKVIIYEDYLAENKIEPLSTVRKRISLAILGYDIYTPKELINYLKQAGFVKFKDQIISERRILLYGS